MAAALFILGLILGRRPGTADLLNGHASALTGATGSFGLGHYRSSGPRPWPRLSLTLGALAAAYFLLANPTGPAGPQDQDTLVPAFYRKWATLWACYQSLADEGPFRGQLPSCRRVTATPAGPTDHGGRAVST